MGIEALAFSALSPTYQGERLSSSLQASTRGVLELRSLENGTSSFIIQGATPKRLCCQTQISADNKGILGNCSYNNRNIVEKASFRLHFSKCNLSSRNQLQWKPVFYGFIEKTQLVGQTTCSPRALQFEENAGLVSDPSVEQAQVFEEDTQLVSNPSVEQAKVGVLLLNLGGPETLKDVQPFLFNLFADPDIIRLPRLFRFLQRPLAQFISAVRAPKSREGYAAIGGGSPLRKITDEQADALRLALEAKNVPAKVYVGMRYWHPFTEEAIEKIKRDGINKLVVLPLYPQFSISTSGSSIRLLESIFREDKYLVSIQCSIISSWYQREGYIKAMASLIEKELQRFGSPEKVMVFFSAHGVPLTYVEEAGDPYKGEMEACVGLIMKELKARGINNEHTLAYQSRVGPVEWLKPYTDETIIQLGQKGVKSLLAVPISFVSEHIETLEEIDMEYKELAIESGIEHWGRVPALGCEPAFISDLADAVIEALPYAREMVVSNLNIRQLDKDYAKSTVALMFSSVLAFALLLGVKLIRTRKNF